MPAEVSTLGELFLANVALEGPLHVVLAEVIPQVAALAKDRVATLVPASKVQFRSLRRLVGHSDRFMPL